LAYVFTRSAWRAFCEREVAGGIDVVGDVVGVVPGGPGVAAPPPGAVVAGEVGTVVAADPDPECDEPELRLTATPMSAPTSAIAATAITSVVVEARRTAVTRAWLGFTGWDCVTF
jgi:hypothetical protein